MEKVINWPYVSGLRKEVARLQAGIGAARLAVPNSSTPQPDEIANAKAVIFDSAAAVDAKLAALGVLRSANARSDDVVRQLVLVYYGTTNLAVRADIFRQLNEVKTPELKHPLLEGVSDSAQSTALREEATESLADYLPDPDVSAWLHHLAANEPDPKVRNQAAKSLEQAQRRTDR
jgi:hypothetical protein